MQDEFLKRQRFCLKYLRVIFLPVLLPTKLWKRTRPRFHEKIFLPACHRISRGLSGLVIWLLIIIKGFCDSFSDRKCEKKVRPSSSSFHAQSSWKSSQQSSFRFRLRLGRRRLFLPFGPFSSHFSTIKLFKHLVESRNNIKFRGYVFIATSKESTKQRDRKSPRTKFVRQIGESDATRARFRISLQALKQKQF